MSNFGTAPKSAGKDDEYYKQLVKYNIFKEAFQQDSEANRLNTSHNNNINLAEIQQKYPASGNIEEYRREARGMAMKDNPLIEFVDNVNDDIIRITDRGRNYWEENPKRDISESNL